mgnify:CR=1 FL=1
MTIRLSIPILAVSLLSWFAVPAAADEVTWTDEDFALDAAIPFDPQVRTGTLENGLRWFVRRNTEPENRAALRLVVNAGSVLEDDDQRGLAHFLEHMAFNGTENFEKQELVEYLESIGMKFGPEINAYTSFDETVYMLQIPTDDDEIVDKAFTVLADWSRRLTIDPEEVVKERGVVLEEWRGGRGARQRVSDEQVPEIYYGSRYAERLPIGLPEIIESADEARLRRFYETWYRPDLMAVIAVGDFDVDAMIAKIQDEFGQSWGSDDPEERVVHEIPEHDDTRFAIVTDPELSNSSVNVLVKDERTPVETVGDFRTELVESMARGMLNTRLNELVQKANPPFVFAGVGENRLGPNLTSQSAYALANQGEIERALEAILVETKRVADHGFTKGELDRAKADQLRSLQSTYEDRENRDNSRLASIYVQRFLRDSRTPGIEWRYEAVKRLAEGITLDEVNTVDLGGAFQQTANRVVNVSAPEADDISVPTEADLLALFDRIESTETEPYDDATSDDPLVANPPTPGSITKEETIDELGLTFWTLSNGHRVVVKPTDFKEDEFSFTAFSPGGRSTRPVNDDLSLTLGLSLVQNGGVADFSAIDLQKKLAGRIASASVSAGTYAENVRGSGSPEDLELALQLAHLRMTAPRRDEEATGALIQRYSAFFENARKDPNRVYSDSLRTILLDDHPFSKRITPERLHAIDLDTALDFYRERMADTGDMTWVFVGNLDLETLRPLVETWIASLPSDGDPDTWQDIGMDTIDGPVHETIHVGVDEKARTTLLMHGDLPEYTRKIRTGVDALAKVLSIELREVIREDKGGTYGVSVNGSTTNRPDEEWSMQVGFGTEPSRLDELVGDAIEVLRDVRDDGVKEETFTKVHEQLIRDHEQNVKENGYWMSVLITRERLGIDHRAELETDQFLEDLSADDLTEIAKWALPVEEIIRVDMLPAQGSDADTK